VTHITDDRKPRAYTDPIVNAKGHRMEAIAGTRYSDSFIAATYGTRSAYVAQLESVIAERMADSYRKYVKRTPAGLGLLSKVQWAERRAAAVAEIRDALKLNRK